MSYDNYKRSQSEIIHNCVEAMKCQPILFVGSGLSRRYLDTPNWTQLMEYLARECPLIVKDLGYFTQKHKDDLVKVASQGDCTHKSFAGNDLKN